ncbi:hypothetical protein HPB48_009282 [Haemaphysalis longicornis]|uniref:Uncharacterized protein n=1 Tax=Haemaphysalis longicornis TaxID=44386 RepID=A0A9J6G614_HAELO|nr:hypothetical protein HPB48_009282 [Haemaphysalis longicornis]
MSNFSSESLTEKPLHKRYLRDFRVERCPCFADHRCQQHRPYTCFYWHFPNQRRRRLSLSRRAPSATAPTCTAPSTTKSAASARTATSAPYCTARWATASADTTRATTRPSCAPTRWTRKDTAPGTGRTAPSRTASATCASPCTASSSGAAAGRPLNDREFVLAHYKAWPCTRPGCRLGSSCPYYHGPRDKRRSPTDHKYVAAACPRLDAGCPDGERCGFAHSGAELRFHPDVYKTTRCRDLEAHRVVSSRCPLLVRTRGR